MKWLFSERRDRRDEVFESILFVDPGLGGTGWAHFRDLRTSPKDGAVVKPSSSGVIRASKGAVKPGGIFEDQTWLNAAAVIAAAFRGVVEATHPWNVVLEQPALWSGSATSHASASSKGGEVGDLFKLAYLVGQLGHVATEATGNLPALVMPHEWKGQLSKELVLKRLAHYGIEARDHEADAAGMGLAAQGLL